MRIIRFFGVLLALSAAMLPFGALASESPNTDINTNIKLNTITEFLFPQTVQAAGFREGLIQTSIVEKSVKTEKEKEYEKILATWKVKQAIKWENLSLESFEINASAYTAAADECDNDKGITASGIKVQEKRTIACPPEFPFGVKIEIEGRGIFVCEDRGGAIKGNHVDIYVQTKKEAFEFGRQKLMAKVVL